MKISSKYFMNYLFFPISTADASAPAFEMNILCGDCGDAFRVGKGCLPVLCGRSVSCGEPEAHAYGIVDPLHK